MADWTDGWWTSEDGIRLHYRDYAGRGDRPPIICIAGLTRNARDFAATADRLAGDRRLICVDLRGRGESGPSRDPMRYMPMTYVADLERLAADLALDRFVLFGTSLGGLVAMLLTAGGRARVAGVLLNDVAPELEPAGLERIRAYVGKPASYPTWLHAARALAAGNAHVYPRYRLEDWLAMAKRLCRVTPSGRIVYDYDMAIAEPIRSANPAGAVDLWPVADAMKGIPGLLVRGARSDVLGEAVAERLVARIGFDMVTVPDTGHAPTLDEPEAVAGIDRLLARAT